MDDLKKTAKHVHFVPIIIFVLLAVALLAVVVGQVGQGGSVDLRSRASRNTFLTPGDDGLSLQQDLNNLGQDPTTPDDQSLDSLQ